MMIVLGHCEYMLGSTSTHRMMIWVAVGNRLLLVFCYFSVFKINLLKGLRRRSLLLPCGRGRASPQCIERNCMSMAPKFITHVRVLTWPQDGGVGIGLGAIAAPTPIQNIFSTKRFEPTTALLESKSLTNE